jgi:hypothetical protein
MDARFDMKLTAAERRNLRGGAARSGLSESAVVRFGMRWAIGRLDVLANGGTLKTGRDIAAFIDELRADPRTAPLAGDVEIALAALDLEGDANRSAAALHDMVGLVAADPLPLIEKIRLLADVLEFEGHLTIRRKTEPAQISQSASG